jgi:hypothetical protein
MYIKFPYTIHDFLNSGTAPLDYVVFSERFECHYDSECLNDKKTLIKNLIKNYAFSQNDEEEVVFLDSSNEEETKISAIKYGNKVIKILRDSNPLDIKNKNEMCNHIFTKKHCLQSEIDADSEYQISEYLKGFVTMHDFLHNNDAKAKALWLEKCTNKLIPFMLKKLLLNEEDLNLHNFGIIKSEDPCHFLHIDNDNFNYLQTSKNNIGLIEYISWFEENEVREGFYVIKEECFSTLPLPIDDIKHTLYVNAVALEEQLNKTHFFTKLGACNFVSRYHLKPTVTPNTDSIEKLESINLNNTHSIQQPYDTEDNSTDEDDQGVIFDCLKLFLDLPPTSANLCCPEGFIA